MLDPNILLLLYGPRRPRTMHVEFLVKNPAEIYSMHDLPQIFARLERWVQTVSRPVIFGLLLKSEIIFQCHAIDLT